MHKVFISYHHNNDQAYKDSLVQLNKLNNLFIDRSVRDGDISDTLKPQTIRHLIRDNWLRDSTVTLLLAGRETRYRKHVDWELKSSMIRGSRSSRSGILVLTLPRTVQRPEQRGLLLPNWYLNPRTRKDFETKYPYMPERIVDNLVSPNAVIEVIPFNSVVSDPVMLMHKINDAHTRRYNNSYDTRRLMRMKDGSKRTYYSRYQY